MSTTEPRLPVVLIPQFPTQMGDCGPERRPLDLTDAERYGRLVEVLTPEAKPWDPTVADELDAAMQETSGDDWLLCLGNPTLIAVAAGAFALMHGRLNVLQFQSRQGRYEAVRFEFDEDGTRVERLTID